MHRVTLYRTILRGRVTDVLPKIMTDLYTSYSRITVEPQHDAEELSIVNPKQLDTGPFFIKTESSSFFRCLEVATNRFVRDLLCECP